MPRVSRAEFARRRRRFLEQLEPGSAALLKSAPAAIRSNDVEYRYRPDSDFYYLTGFPEPDAAALFLPGHPKEEFVLFVAPRDAERETWTGRRCGVEGAAEYGADMAYPIDRLEPEVGRYLEDRERLYISTGRDGRLARLLPEWMQQWRQSRARNGRGPVALFDAAAIVHEMRLIKSEEEIAAMRAAIALTAVGHRAAMAERCPGMAEYEIEAILEYHFRRGGGAAAYPPIVASGPNAATLHYTANERRLEERDWVLVDAGAEYDMYCADVTRTYPVGRSLSGAARDVFEIVAAAQEAAIAVVGPGARFDDVHARAVRVLAEGMVSIGLLKGDVDEIVEKELYKPFYMHRTSHWLGMDVHDAGRYKIDGESRLLQPGMVLTVEPGIYVKADQPDVGPRWAGLGVRIEDDVLVTASGCEVLTREIPKLPAELR